MFLESSQPHPHLVRFIHKDQEAIDAANPGCDLVFVQLWSGMCQNSKKLTMGKVLFRVVTWT